MEIVRIEISVFRSMCDNDNNIEMKIISSNDANKNNVMWINNNNVDVNKKINEIYVRFLVEGIFLKISILHCVYSFINDENFM